MGLFGSKRQENSAAGGNRLRLLETMKGDAGKLTTIPTLPSAAVKAMAALKDPDCSLGTLAEIVGNDLALTAGILRLANSALYRTGRAIASLDQAVLRLGMRECQNLILTVSMHSLFRRVGTAQRIAAEQLWKHSLFTASLCRHLNRSLSLGFTGEEFACGIGHDLGRILIVLLAFDAFQQADPLDFDEGPDILKREQQVLGTDHCVFGAWYASMNQLPTSLLSAMQFHHQPSEAGEQQFLVSLVAMADHMANYLQRSLPIDEYLLDSNVGWSFLANRLSADQRQGFEERMHGLLESIVEEVGETIAPAA